MSRIEGPNGYAQAQKIAFTPPVHRADQDTRRYQAEDKARTDHPVVRVTLSPEAQKALAAQKPQT